MNGRKIWVILLAIWLIIYGAIQLFSLSFEGISVVLGLLALGAGIALIADR